MWKIFAFRETIKDIISMRKLGTKISDFQSGQKLFINL